jgi:hypothetical protein
MAAIGDFDDDGIADLAVGAEDDDDGGLSSGTVWLLMMNADGTVKQSSKISNTSGNFSGGLDAGDQFGQAVESLGDYDNDGFADIAVGAEFDSDSGQPAGAAWLLSLNIDGTVNSHFKINDNTPGFGGQLTHGMNSVRTSPTLAISMVTAWLIWPSQQTPTTTAETTEALFMCSSSGGVK